MFRPPPDPREPVGKQDKARNRDDCPADPEQQQPPAVDPVALRPVHNMQPPDKVEQAPGVAAGSEHRAAGCIDVDAGIILIAVSDLPRRERTTEFGPDSVFDEACGRYGGRWPGPGTSGDGPCARGGKGREEHAAIRVAERDAFIVPADLGYGPAGDRARRKGNHPLSAIEPFWHDSIGGQNLRRARNDMFGPNLFDVEERHQRPGDHPQEHLDADKDRQPFVKLAAQHMKTQLERACRQSVFPRSDQLLRGARDDEWY